MRLKAKTKFELGEIVVTRGIDDRMKRDPTFNRFVQVSLNRYIQCDWGDMKTEDKNSNNEALKEGNRLLAVYILPNTDVKIWIITEWDRSVTTILFPDEYYMVGLNLLSKLEK